MERHPSEVTATVEDDVKLMDIPVDYVDVWLTKYNTWKSFIMRSIRSRFIELIKSIDQIAFQKLDEITLINGGQKSVSF
ncbi:MAG TPA: hypothetical protein VFX43_13675 [Chitinophagaceae bacterium]|nr:hypothetical protein [Chitinophagaceae bacterium]